METIEIRKVKNGYIVLPTYHNQGSFTPNDTVNVFESFESLIAFLKSNFKEPIA